MIDETMWGRVAQCHVDAEDTECFLVGRIVWSNAQWVLTVSYTHLTLPTNSRV